MGPMTARQGKRSPPTRRSSPRCNFAKQAKKHFSPPLQIDVLFAPWTWRRQSIFHNGGNTKREQRKGTAWIHQGKAWTLESRSCPQQTYTFLLSSIHKGIH
ncbi:unnamed protein product, partial [Heterosigma akashiwo]